MFFSLLIVYCVLSIDFHYEELSIVPCIINIVNTDEQITTFDLYSKMQSKVMVIENDRNHAQRIARTTFKIKKHYLYLRQ